MGATWRSGLAQVTSKLLLAWEASPPTTVSGVAFRLLRQTPTRHPERVINVRSGKVRVAVVVGAAVEPRDPVLDRVARGQHEHRRPDAIGAQRPDSGKPVDAGQHDVEDDGVIG